jgi:hypothetical protein
VTKSVTADPGSTCRTFRCDYCPDQATRFYLPLDADGEVRIDPPIYTTKKYCAHHHELSEPIWLRPDVSFEEVTDHLREVSFDEMICFEIHEV